MEIKFNVGALKNKFESEDPEATHRPLRSFVILLEFPIESQEADAGRSNC